MTKVPIFFMFDLTNPKTIKELLSEENLRPNKSLGQNFLISRKIVDKIISVADLSSKDTVLEIGPGFGVLTLELAKHAKKIIAVEKDKQLIKILQNNINNQNIQNVKIIENDILELTTYNLNLTTYKLISNLPYQITSPILWKFLHEENSKPSLMVIMIQKEVADRLIAKPGDMSLLSVLAQYYAEVSIVSQVKKTLFYPAPKVDSTVIKLNLKKINSSIDNKKIFNLIKNGFASKRKTLKNNLKSIFSDRDILNALNKSDLKENSRAQELSIKDWLKLYKVLYNK